jgi:hypothetical protein
MRKIIFSLCLCILTTGAITLSACSSIDSAYKSTKSFYFTHVNRPAMLNVTDRTVLERTEQGLVQRIMTIDEELTKLEKALDALATPPDAASAATLMRRFPWLSGLAMIAPDGTLGASIPSTPLKQIDYTPLLQLAPKALPRDLRGMVQDTPLGPEILLARPFMQEDTLQVLLVASFDFRSLLPFASSPSDMIVRSTDTLIWNGDLDYTATPMAAVDWGDYLKTHSDGVLSDDKGSMVWVSRYMGGIPLVFATKAQ